MNDRSIDELQEMIDDLRLQIADLKSLVEVRGVPQSACVNGDVGEPVPPDAAISRRHALRTAGVLAAGAIAGGAAALATATPAAAATGSYTSSDSAVPAVAAIATGSANSVRAWAADGLAVDAYSSNGTYGSRFENDGAGGTAIRALAYGNPGNGFTGGFAIWATGDVGLYTNSTSVGVSASAPVQLELNGSGVTRPTTRVNAHRAGQIVFDSSGELWVCVTAGSPGTWRKLSSANSAGAFHAVTPGRVHDSRVAAGGPGVLGTGSSRTISVANRMVVGSTPGLTDFVPVGAVAISANITVTTTSGVGNLAINPGGDTVTHGSIINWTAAGQTFANGVTLTLNSSRQLQVICNGAAGASANFIIDVLGYWM